MGCSNIFVCFEFLVVVVGCGGVEYWLGYDLDFDVDCGWVGCIVCIVGCCIWYGGDCVVDWWCVGFGGVGDGG